MTPFTTVLLIPWLTFAPTPPGQADERVRIILNGYPAVEWKSELPKAAVGMPMPKPGHAPRILKGDFTIDVKTGKITLVKPVDNAPRRDNVLANRYEARVAYWKQFAKDNPDNPVGKYRLDQLSIEMDALKAEPADQPVKPYPLATAIEDADRLSKRLVPAGYAILIQTGSNTLHVAAIDPKRKTGYPPIPITSNGEAMWAECDVGVLKLIWERVEAVEKERAK